MLWGCVLWGPLVVVALVVGGALGALAVQVAPVDLWHALGERETLFAARLSLQTSLSALAVAVLLAVPTAYALAKHRFPGKALVEVLLDLPMVTPPLIAGMGLLFLLGRHSPVGGALGDLGMSVLFSPIGIVVAQAYVATSVIVRGARAAFQALDPPYADVAATLGLAPGWVFLLVDVPMAARGIVSAAVLGWARALGEFGATLMLAGATRLHTETLPMAIYLNIASGEPNIAIACALLLLALAFVLLLIIRALSGRDRLDLHKPQRHARRPT